MRKVLIPVLLLLPVSAVGQRGPYTALVEGCVDQWSLVRPGMRPCELDCVLSNPKITPQPFPVEGIILNAHYETEDGCRIGVKLDRSSKIEQTYFFGHISQERTFVVSGTPVEAISEGNGGVYFTYLGASLLVFSVGWFSGAGFTRRRIQRHSEVEQ